MGRSQKISLFLAFCAFVGRVSRTRGQENVVRYTSYGERCKEDCDKHGSGYFWCTTKIGWDYCSKTEHTDYRYEACRDDHPCGKYGKSYTWCYNKAGSWGYCGFLLSTVEPKTLSYTSSRYRSECRDGCLYDRNSKYFWCNTDKGWDYCSPLPDVTYRNEPCRSDHACGTHSYGYNWCRTNSGYDYCGVLNPGECQYSITGLDENQSNVAVLVCTQWSGGTRLKTKFTLEPDQSEIADGSCWRKELTSLIAQWKNTYLSENRTSHLISTENLHIDLQEATTKDDRKYYRVEIQANSCQSDESAKNTVVAQVLVPVRDAVPSRFVRTAFAESFKRRAKISLDVTTAQSY